MCRGLPLPHVPRGRVLRMGHLAITAMGAGLYFAEHDERDRQVAEALGGYYVKGDAQTHYFGRALSALGIEGDVTPERTAQLMKDTWTQLRHHRDGGGAGHRTPPLRRRRREPGEDRRQGRCQPARAPVGQGGAGQQGHAP